MRQFSVVTHYGKKSDPFALWIRDIQREIKSALGDHFRQYHLDQIHCTIIGLEGYKSGDGVLNRYTHKRIKFEQIFQYIKTFPRTPIQIGGFKREGAYMLKSRDKTLYERSFCIGDDGSVVVIGWPKPDIQSDAKTMDQIRRDFLEFNVCHKYHALIWSNTKNEEGRRLLKDNDIFFVIGKVVLNRIAQERVKMIEKNIREFLEGLNDGIEIVVQPASISVVGYIDPQLPLDSSFSIDLNSGNPVDAISKGYPP
jgi:hypothetical protein